MGISHKQITQKKKVERVKGIRKGIVIRLLIG